MKRRSKYANTFCRWFLSEFFSLIFISPAHCDQSMSKRRVSSRQATDLGLHRIGVLTSMASEATREGRADRARRYVELARRIGMKTRTGIPKDFRYCEGCLVPLVPGVSCTVRLNNSKVSITCTECGAVKRLPYMREQRDDRERSQKRADETRQ